MTNTTISDFVLDVSSGYYQQKYTPESLTQQLIKVGMTGETAKNCMILCDIAPFCSLGIEKNDQNIILAIVSHYWNYKKTLLNFLYKFLELSHRNFKTYPNEKYTLDKNDRLTKRIKVLTDLVRDHRRSKQQNLSHVCDIPCRFCVIESELLKIHGAAIKLIKDFELGD